MIRKPVKESLAKKIRILLDSDLTLGSFFCPTIGQWSTLGICMGRRERALTRKPGEFLDPREKKCRTCPVMKKAVKAIVALGPGECRPKRVPKIVASQGRKMLGKGVYQYTTNLEIENASKPKD